MRVGLRPMAVLLALAAMISTAGAAGDGWMSWELTFAAGWNLPSDKLAAWQLALHEDGRVSTSWVGPMHPVAEGELATLEGLEAIGTYTRGERTITFENEDFGDGWLWSFPRVTCAIEETATTLKLSACEGYDPPPFAEGAAQPGDMTFRRVER